MELLRNSKDKKAKKLTKKRVSGIRNLPRTVSVGVGSGYSGADGTSSVHSCDPSERLRSSRRSSRSNDDKPVTRWRFSQRGFYSRCICFFDEWMQISWACLATRSGYSSKRY